jgi:hypothetical protein
MATKDRQLIGVGQTNGRVECLQNGWEKRLAIDGNELYIIC